MVLNLPAPLLASGRLMRRRPEAILLFLGLIWAVWLTLQAGGPSVTPTTNESLLHGMSPSQAQDVKRADVLTDGIRPRTGDAWSTDLTAIFKGRSSILYDLGESKDIRAAYLIGDGNDDYVLTVSEDGTSFEPLWKAGPASGGGMQPRSATDLSGRGRYVRIAGRGGDGLFSIGEVQLFDKVPSEIPAGTVVRSGLPQGERIRGHFLHFVIAMGVMLFASRRESAWWWKLLTTLVPVVAGTVLVQSIVGEWPIGAQEVAMARAASAAIAVVALLREVLSPTRFPAARGVVLPALALAGLLAVGSFYNLGRLQFEDHDKGRQTFVHTFDMRVYYPAAKYFPELRFDGLYLASVAALVADVPGTTRSQMQRVQLRDLKTHRMLRAGDVWEEILAMEKRFTPERWESFLRDMRYFRLTMGPDYLGSMVDHGANATPVWMAQANLLFAATEADETTLVLGGLLDPALLLLAFAAVGRAYGWRAAFLCMVVFGANDFVMLGSNWAGATLRHDWLAYLLLGISALKVKRYRTGGVLLAMATAARAFPALALVGLAFPILGWLISGLVRSGNWPAKSAWFPTHRDTFRVWGAAIAGGVVLFLLASLVLSFNAWPEWLNKVRMLETDPHVNEVGLRSMVAGSDFAHQAILRSRTTLFVLIGAAIAVGAGFIAWRRSLDQAAILGCLLIPVIFNPANYYIHFITILPLLACTLPASDQKAAPSWNQIIIWGALLLLCVAQYWTTKINDRAIHFEQATVLLFVSFAAVLIGCYRADEHQRTSNPSDSQSSASMDALGT